MKTRAKFTCRSVTKYPHYNGPGRYLYEATLEAVMDGSKENDSFFEATPVGSIKISTMKENHFDPGQDYYVDFTRVTD